MAGTKQLREDDVDLDDDLDVDDNELDNDDDTGTGDDGDGNEGKDEGKDDGSETVELDDDDGDEGTADQKTEEEREAIRERRRQERKEKKEHQRQAQETQRRELLMIKRERDEMRQRLELLERKTTGSELAQIDNAIEETNRIGEAIKERIRVATEANDGTALAEATDHFYQVKQRSEQLTRIKQAAVNSTQQREQRSPIDPRLQRNAEAWMSKNTWYNPAGGDIDSKVALQIDNAMGEEGWDPREPEYWDELTSRLEKYLPHRMNRRPAPQRSEPAARNKPPARTSGSGRDSGGGSGSPAQFKVSAERVQAMKDAGIWDDTEARNKMIKSYREFDKQNEKT